MKPVAQVVLTGALVGGAGIAAWTFLPKLQAPSSLVAIEAGENSEIARRLIDQYDPAAEVARTAVDRSGFASDLTDDRIGTLVEGDSHRAQDVLDQEANRINDMLKDSVNRLRQHDQKFNELSGESVTTTQGSVNFGNNTGSMTKHMTDGLSQSKNVGQSNTSLLKSATGASAKALQASFGEASGRDSLVGNRMNGVALYHEGMAVDRKARIVRAEADSRLVELSKLAVEQQLQMSEADIVNGSGIVASIEKQRERLAEAESAHAAIAKSVEDTESNIAAVKGEIETQSAMASSLRTQLDALESRGVEFGSQNAGDTFEREYKSLSSSYRNVLSRAHALQHGSIAGAHLEMGGDLVTGQYVPDQEGGEIEYELGLDELERRLVQLGWEESGAKQVLDDERAELDRLEGLKSSFETRASTAQSAIQEGNQQAATIFANYQELAAETASLEDDAIETLKNASQAFTSARRAAQSRMTDLPQLSPEKEEQSPGALIKKDRWLVGQMASQSADSQTRAAMILYDRYSHLGNAIALCENLESTFPELDLKLAEMSDAIASTKTSAEEILEDAIDGFEGASQGFESHWSVAASVAAADYMLALFEHPELVDVAIANYQSVVKDRETEPLLRPFVDRLEQLRNR
ncbi:MAG: hypothetical protein DHS20C16_19130 [Phycisphaerae bacterium]|nr:MAG: hypothetical protein DHS20C16_19130 [Phycisphaerae bacterium]